MSLPVQVQLVVVVCLDRPGPRQAKEAGDEPVNRVDVLRAREHNEETFVSSSIILRAPESAAALLNCYMSRVRRRAQFHTRLTATACGA